MKEVKVFFENGYKFITRINGTDKEILEYYKKGKVFNLGNGEKDLLSRVKKAEVLKDGI